MPQREPNRGLKAREQAREAEASEERQVEEDREAKGSIARIRDKKKKPFPLGKREQTEGRDGRVEKEGGKAAERDG